MFRGLISAGVAAFAVNGFAAWRLDRELAADEFWAADPMLLVTEHRAEGFNFTSGAKDAADSRQGGAVECFGFPVYETVIRFGEDGGVAAVEISFYNNGGVETTEEKRLDDGSVIRRRKREDREIGREDFLSIKNAVAGRMTAKGEKTPEAEDGAMRTAEIRDKAIVWTKPAFGGAAKLSWSYTQKGKSVDTFKPGYIKLTVERRSAGAAVKDAANFRAAAKGAVKITDNIVRDSRGVFLDNIPMVDQGMKGYCAVASCERVLKYYGVDVDEHEIANAAGTSADGGTSTLSMKQAVEKIGKRYKLGTVVCYGDFEKSNAERIAGIVKEVADYNKAAKKLKAKEIAPDVYISHQGNMTVYDPSAVDKAMEPKVLVSMKVNGAQKSKYRKFVSDIHDQINKGIPLFWGVKIGIAPEPEIPQADGYHMRLIIGYNDKSNEIVYTDSWGAGHEFKTMRADWAWTITRSLIYMKPLLAKQY